MSLPDLNINIIVQILDFVAGSPYDLSQLECAVFSMSMIRTEIGSNSFRSRHCERWARLVSATTDLYLSLPASTLLDQSLKEGALVRLQSESIERSGEFVNKSEWNGELVLVEERDDDTDRYACRRLQDGRLISCKRGNLLPVQGLIPISVWKSALRIRSISAGLQGGWRGLTAAQFLRGMQLLQRIHMERPHGRIKNHKYVDFRNPWSEIREVDIKLDRMLIAHVDVFFDEEAIVPIFESFTRSNVDAVGFAHSRPVEVEVDGETAELVLKFESKVVFPHPDLPQDQPHVGLYCYLDLEEFRLRAKGGDDDVLVVSCEILSASHQHLRASHELEKFDITGFIPAMQPWHGLYRSRRGDFLFGFDPAGPCHTKHIVTLVLHTGSAAVWRESSWRNTPGQMALSPMIRTAVWNRNLSGTGTVPIIHPEQNDQALEPFPEHTFTGSIALLRRGGGNGFAQKTAAAEAAGALGCVVFDGDGHLDSEFPACGLMFEGVTHPTPGIPMLLVDHAVGMRLSAASRCGARAQIHIESSRDACMKLPPELEEFRRTVLAGEPLHFAVQIERKTPAPAPEKKKKKKKRS